MLILTLLSVIAMIAGSICFYIFSIIYSVHTMNAGSAMQSNANSEVASTGNTVHTIGLVSLILSIIGFGLVSIILCRVFANKTDPDLYDLEAEDSLTEEEIAELTPLERIQAKRDGLIGGSANLDNVPDMREDGTFMKAIISMIVFFVGLVLVFVFVGGATQNMLEYTTITQDGGSWEDNGNSPIILEQY